MSEVLSDQVLDRLFHQARTHSAWLEKPVTDDTRRRLYDVMKWAPTSANCNPARIVFLRTQRGKERLLPALAAGNVVKTMTAPVTAIIAYDLKFYEKLPPRSPRLAFEEACTLL